MQDTDAGNMAVVYRDKWVRVIGTPVVAAFAYYLTYNNIKPDLTLVYEFLSDCFKIFMVWQAIRGLVVWLDGPVPWSEKFTGRLLVQLLLTCVVGSAVLTVLVLLEYAFIRDYPLEHFYDFDLVIANIFILLSNVVYVSLYFYDVAVRQQAQRQHLEAKLQERNQPAMEYLTVRNGRRQERVALPEILCAYSEEKETYLLSDQLKLYLLDVSLEQLERQLPESLFFRANRKFILSQRVVAGVEPEANGKLAVQLQNSPRLPSSISVSRLKAPAFRQWLKR